MGKNEIYVMTGEFDRPYSDSNPNIRLANKKEKERHNRLMKTYGISLIEWQELSKNGCWICGRTEGRLNVDHRHVSKYKDLSPEEKRKEVRGCLCFLCNVMISKLERRKCARWLLERTCAYFRVYKMFGDGQ